MGGESDVRELVDDIDAVVFEAEARTLRVLFVNQRVEALLGYPIARWLEEPDFWAAHIHPDDRVVTVATAAASIRASCDYVIEYRFVIADGRTLWLRDIVRVVADDRGEPTRLRGVRIDITERKQVEQALADSESARGREEEKFRALIEHSTDLVSILDANGIVRYASPSHERWVGWRPEELTGRSAFEFVHPDDLPSLAATFATGIGAPGFTATREFRYRTRDGGWRVLEGRAMSLLDDPVIQGAVVNLRDVTERRQVEIELRRRLEAGNVVAEAARLLSSSASVELRSAMDRVLEMLGRHLEASHVFIALFSHGHRTWDVRCEWSAEGRSPLGPALQNIPSTQFPRMLRLLEEIGWVQVACLDELPELGAVRRKMEEVGFEAGMCLRMAARGQTLGFLACAQAGAGRTFTDSERELLTVVGEIGANAIARKQDEDMRGALLDFSRNLVGETDLRTLLSDVQPKIASMLGAEIVATYLADEPGGPMRVVAAAGVAPDSTAGYPPPGIDADHPIRAVLRAGATAVGNDVTEQMWFSADALASFAVEHFLVAPLQIRSELRGAIGVARRKGSRAFDGSEVQLLEGIALQVALAVESSEAHHRMKVEATVGSALARVGSELIASLGSPTLVDRLTCLTAQMLGCDFGHTFLRSESTSTLVTVASFGEASGPGYTQRLRWLPVWIEWRLRSRMDDDLFVLAESDDAEAARFAALATVPSIVCMALRRGDELAGVLVAGRNRGVARLRPEQKRIARGIGQLASLTLTNVRAIEELERVSRLKSDFLATMSHELRTPLNVILGYADLLRDGAFGDVDGEQDDVLRRVQSSATELLELINATLNVGRLESGTVPVETRSVDLAALVEEVREELMPACAPAGVDLVWQVSRDVRPLDTDPLKVKVIVKNLVGNALKFTEYGRVCVALREEGGAVEIAVSDTGIGMSAAVQATMFEAFRQGDSSSTRRHGGVGLGLYIVRRMLELIGGTIEVESASGMGSTFRVRLPRV